MNHRKSNVQNYLNDGISPYSDYKDSGIDWLGEIPAHWEVKRLKYLATVNDEALPETTDPSLEIGYVDIGNVDSIRGITDTEVMLFQDAPSRARRVVRQGDVIVSTVRTYLRAIAQIEKTDANLIVSTGFAVVRPRQMEHRYLAYAVNAPHFVERVVANSVGVSYPAINASELACLDLAIPLLHEQRAIAAFLDRETSRIDALVAKKERLIELLQEKRSALISRVVTRGLTPNVAMKDSGVEWLGEIPVHWEVRRLRTLANVATGGRDTVDQCEDGRYPFFVRSQTVERIDTWSFDGEAVLTAGDGGVAKVFHYANGKFDFHQRVYKFSNFRIVTGRFFYYYFMAMLRFEVLKGTAKSTVESLRLPMLQNFPVVVFTPTEQTSIVAYLDRETAKIDALVTKIVEANDHLKELRQALISAAVTGKINVRKTP